MIPPSSKPRIFVSSVIEGFAAYRAAARQAIIQARAEPVMVNEDFPSQNASSRNACLDAIASADIFLLIIGVRGGWRTPSGRLVVEEEYEHARSRRLPILVLIEDGEQDDDAKQLSRKVSDYVDGYFRVRFRGPDGVARELERALAPLIETSQRPAMQSDELSVYFKRKYQVRDETSLRFVLAPERQEEILDPARLASEEFVDRLFEIGHSKSVALFSYQRAKDRPSIANDALIIEQPAGDNWSRGIQAVRMEIHESGAIVIDSNVTGRSERVNSSDMMHIFRIAIEEVEAALATDFRFCSAVFEEVDPYKRHQRFFWNACLSGLGHRSFARAPQPSRSYTMDMSDREDQLWLFPRGVRLIG